MAVEQVAGVGLGRGRGVGADDGGEAAASGPGRPAGRRDRSVRLLVQTARHRAGGARGRPAPRPRPGTAGSRRRCGRGRWSMKRSNRRRASALVQRRAGRGEAPLDQRPRAAADHHAAPRQRQGGEALARAAAAFSVPTRSGAVSTRVPSRSKAMVAPASGAGCEVAAGGSWRVLPFRLNPPRQRQLPSDSKALEPVHDRHTPTPAAPP